MISLILMSGCVGHFGRLARHPKALAVTCLRLLKAPRELGEGERERERRRTCVIKNYVRKAAGLLVSNASIAAAPLMSNGSVGDFSRLH